jgi:SAM-dependent methyltransferase
MAAHGWDATGFDFSLTAQALAHRVGNVQFLARQSEVDDLPEHSFDCITLSQVLEHIPEPLVLLRRLKRLLKPGRIIVVSVPNIGSIQAKIAGDLWWGLDVPRHLTHFSPESLRRTLEAVGLSIVRMDHFTLQTRAPYAFYHSTLDRFFTRRHFLSDFFNHTLPPDCGALEIAYNVTALIILTPILLPLSLLETLVSSRLKRSGFIEATATNPVHTVHK